MNEDSQTIGEILEIEHEAFFVAEKKYGDFFANAMSFNNLLNNFIQEANPDAYIFVMFLSQVKKYNLLATLSVLRQHHVQGMLDLRQMLEAGTNAAYGLANPDHEDFVVTAENNILSAPKSLTKKRYNWLDTNYFAGSQAIKRMKDNINNSCAHSSMIYVFDNFDMEEKKKRKFGMSFFDKNDEYRTKTDLWFISNSTMALMDLFNGVNKNTKRIKLVNGFERQLLDLEKENQQLKTRMEKHPRYIATMERSVSDNNTN